MRLRLTLAYWRIFLASAAALLFITIGLWQGGTTSAVPGASGPRHLADVAAQHSSDLYQLLIVSGIALAIMAVLSIALGWLMAERLLQPVRAITATAREISATNLHERLSFAGPADELKELADTFDDLLTRLERSFAFERQFVANASHELRTPLTAMRVWLDVAMAKPEPIPPQTSTLADRLHNELDHVDRLLDSFLDLAHSQQGPAADESVLLLDDIASAAIAECSAAIARQPLAVEHVRTPHAYVKGSETLLTRMVANVIDNAVIHNQPGGWLRVTSEVEAGLAHLVVENGGPVLAQADVEQLALPFRRLGAERTATGGGSGLGLSIVQSIAEVHGGTLDLRARSDGGLRVTITLPLAVAPPAGARA